MSDLILYRKMYFQLFHDVTSIIAVLDFAYSGSKEATGIEKEQVIDGALEIAITGLRKAQQKTEQMYVKGEA